MINEIQCQGITASKFCIKYISFVIISVTAITFAMLDILLNKGNY